MILNNKPKAIIELYKLFNRPSVIARTLGVSRQYVDQIITENIDKEERLEIKFLITQRSRWERLKKARTNSKKNYKIKKAKQNGQQIIPGACNNTGN